MTDRRDQRLIRRAQQGSRRALDTLVREHRDRAYSVALGVVRNPHDAADVTQEAFIKVVRHLDQFDGRSKFNTWLHRIVVRSAYDFLRKRTPEPVDDVSDVAQHGSPHEQHLDATALLQAIATISEDFRAAVVLVDVLGWPMADVAATLDVKPGTVKSRVFRGRAELAQILGTLGYDGASEDMSTHE